MLGVAVASTTIIKEIWFNSDKDMFTAKKDRGKEGKLYAPETK